MDVQKLIDDAKIPLAKLDIPTLIGVSLQILEALPAIEAGIAKAAPFVEALGTTLAGNTPTDEQWLALTARLDAGSEALQAAAAEAQKELDAQGGGGASANGGALTGASTSDPANTGGGDGGSPGADPNPAPAVDPGAATQQ